MPAGDVALTCSKKRQPHKLVLFVPAASSIHKEGMMTGRSVNLNRCAMKLIRGHRSEPDQTSAWTKLAAECSLEDDLDIQLTMLLILPRSALSRRRAATCRLMMSNYCRCLLVLLQH